MLDENTFGGSVPKNILFEELRLKQENIDSLKINKNTTI